MRRSRTRTLLPIAMAGGAALALAASAPAFALTTTWISPTDSWWSSATWGGTVPAAGDDVVFAGGPRSTYNLGGVGFSSFEFTNTHTIANGGGSIGLTDGITVADGAEAAIEPMLTTTGSQQWTIEAGGALTLPSQVNADPAATLTLEVDGSLTITSTGNLDGGSAACVVKTGFGVLRIEGGGGGVGACADEPEGLDVGEGYVDIAPGASLGGKSFNVTNGTLIGGAPGAPGIVRQLNLGDGVVSPGGNFGLAIGALDLWGTSTWSGGSYEADWDPTTGDADLVRGVGQAISVSGTHLMPYVLGSTAPSVETAFTVLSSDVGISGGFLAPDGAPLADGDEFVSAGQVYRYGQTGNEVTLTWLRAAPEPPGPNPPAPTPPAKVDTAAA